MVILKGAQTYDPEACSPSKKKRWAMLQLHNKSLALHRIDHQQIGASQREEETEWGRKKEATERGREVCGREERRDVISIDSQAEHTFAGRCGCYH